MTNSLAVPVCDSYLNDTFNGKVLNRSVSDDAAVSRVRAKLVNGLFWFSRSKKLKLVLTRRPTKLLSRTQSLKVKFTIHNQIVTISLGKLLTSLVVHEKKY